MTNMCHTLFIHNCQYRNQRTVSCPGKLLHIVTFSVLGLLSKKLHSISFGAGDIAISEILW